MGRVIMTRFIASAAATAVFVVLVALPAGARATPIDTARIPAEADGVGHVDMDALRRTQLHRLLAPKLMVHVNSGHENPASRNLVKALIDSVQSVSFWITKNDAGAVLVQVPDARRIQALLDKLPRRGPIKVAGVNVYRYSLDGKAPHPKDDDDSLIALVGNTFILSDDTTSLAKAINAASRRGPTLASTRAVVDGALERGVFFFTSLNAKMLDKVKDAAQSQTLRINMSGLTVNVGEVNAQVRVKVKLTMGTPQEAQQIKSMVEGVLALVSMSDEAAEVRPLAKTLKVTTVGKAVEMNASMGAAELVKLIESKK